MKKLSELKTGNVAIIERFHSDTFAIKLMEMGCVPGEKIRIDKIAPLGDPICVQVAGYSLSLRVNEAAEILVTEIN